MDVNGNASDRRSATYHPSVWGDYFLHYDSDLTEIDPSEEQEVQQLKEEIRNVLMDAYPPTSLEKLELIDNIQRLGVSYHFEDEIEDSLRHVFDAYDDCNNGNDKNNLHLVALRFRLLRQAGHNVSCRAFEKFKDKDGKFKESLIKDVKGMLSLHEATYLGVHGEAILEEALIYTTSHLKSILPRLNKFDTNQVTRALNSPIRRTLERVGAREYICIYQDDQAHNDVLLKLAKLDFNLLQKIHQRELSGITRWWKELDVPTTFYFARDRLVECYFWILGIYFEPKYSFSRKITTQLIALWTILDDVYDVHGTYDELTLFTNAIQRWDISASNELPPYMKKLYLAILAVTTEVEQVLAEENKQFHVAYAIGEMKRHLQTYYEEFVWYYTKYVPTFEEYKKVSLISSGYLLFATICLMGMGDVVTKEVLDWVTSQPLAVEAICYISRFMDDLAGHEFEQERGHSASAVECYMKDYNVTKQEAYVEIEKLISKSWKDLNQECLNPTRVPMTILQRILNLARAIVVLYKDKDIYTNSKVKLKHIITITLVHRVPI